VNVDLERVVAEVDVDTLQDNVEHITFADIGQEGIQCHSLSLFFTNQMEISQMMNGMRLMLSLFVDLRYFTDANFIQLFRLTQVGCYTIPYHTILPFSPLMHGLV
jgi:hypothetical protein